MAGWALAKGYEDTFKLLPALLRDAGYQGWRAAQACTEESWMSLAHAKNRRFNRKEYYSLSESGILKPNERTELIDGEIVLIPAQNLPHANAVTSSNMVLTATFFATHVVRCQLPVTLADDCEPEPDFALVAEDRDGTPGHSGALALLGPLETFTTESISGSMDASCPWRRPIGLDSASRAHTRTVLKGLGPQNPTPVSSASRPARLTPARGR